MTSGQPHRYPGSPNSFLNAQVSLEKLHFSLTLKDTGLAVSQTPHRSLDPSTCNICPETATRGGPGLPLGSASGHAPQDKAFCPYKAVPRNLAKNQGSCLLRLPAFRVKQLQSRGFCNIISELGLLFPPF